MDMEGVRMSFPSKCVLFVITIILNKNGHRMFIDLYIFSRDLAPN